MRVLLALIFIILVVLGLGYFFPQYIKMPFSKKQIEMPASVGRTYVNPVATDSTGKLEEGFPEFPVHEKMTLDKSFKKVQDGKTDYGAVWYYDGDLEENIDSVMNWYAEELKKAGWTVDGPNIHESKYELVINAENSKYYVYLFNSEREDEGQIHKEGEIMVVDILEK